MTFSEAIERVLEGDIVTDGELEYRMGGRFLECRQGYLGWKPQCPYWTRKQLKSTKWKVVDESDENKTLGEDAP